MTPAKLVYDAIAMGFQGTRPALSEKEKGRQWANDVKAVIRSIRGRDTKDFNAGMFLTLTGYNEDCQKAWDIR